MIVTMRVEQEEETTDNSSGTAKGLGGGGRRSFAPSPSSYPDAVIVVVEDHGFMP
jgi:hypothetical protein